MKKIKGWAMFLMLAFVIGVLFGLTVPAQYADAGLSKPKAVAFMGLNYDTLGNAVEATDAITVQTGRFPDELNCFFSVQNVSGVIVANTSTVNIETSYKGADWDIFQTVSVVASVVTGVRNTGSTTTPFGDQWRMRLTAVQNANAYTTGQCWFE